MPNTINRTNFVLFKTTDMSMEKLKLTDKEFDLIMAIRNYKNSYPNGYPEIRWYIEKLFNELLAEAENEDED